MKKCKEMIQLEKERKLYQRGMMAGREEEREKNLKIIKIWDNKVDTLVNDLIEEIKQSSPIKESEK